MSRIFLWKGEELEKVNGGHCRVNWPTMCTPNGLRGLGVTCTRTSSTLVLVPVEKGGQALEWTFLVTPVWFMWQHQKTLPHPFSSVPKGKKIMVQRALHDDYLIDQIWPFTIGEEIREYTNLWEKIHTHACDPKTKDENT